MQLSKKPKIFSNLFFAFRKFTSIFEELKKEKINLRISEFRDSEKIAYLSV